MFGISASITILYRDTAKKYSRTSRRLASPSSRNLISYRFINDITIYEVYVDVFIAVLRFIPCPKHSYHIGGIQIVLVADLVHTAHFDSPIL